MSTPQTQLRADLHSGTAALLDSCFKLIRRYVVLSADQLNVLAAWILHTWAIEAADFTPYLHITAPEKGCGKSRLLETLEIAVRNPVKTGGMSAAALMRTVNAQQPSLLLDEMDATFQGDKDVAQALRGILNEGFRRGGNIRKCVGPNHDVQAFHVFGAKALAGIGKVPDTVASRSIIIEMRRKTPTESVEPFRVRDVREGAMPLVESLASWSNSETMEILRGTRPKFPDGLTDRQQDISEPLLAIADLAGAEWPSKIRHSLTALFRSAESEDSSLGVNLLRDIRSIFGIRSGKDSDKIYSAELANTLCGIEGSPWAEWDKGRGLTANTLAKRLKPFHISPLTIRTGAETGKGYKRDAFTDAWDRYLAPMPIAASSPVTHPVNIEDYSPFTTVTSTFAADKSSHEKPHQSSVVTAVTPLTPLAGKNSVERFIEGAF